MRVKYGKGPVLCLQKLMRQAKRMIFIRGPKIISYYLLLIINNYYL